MRLDFSPSQPQAWRLGGLALGLLVGFTGCEPSSANRSPTPDQDPERYAQAQVETKTMIRESREAEARFIQHMGNQAIAPPEDLEIETVLENNLAHDNNE